MTKYTRQKFRAWLETLPMGEPFCDKHNCPIAQFIGLDSVKAQWEDAELAWAIDDVSPRLGGFDRDWVTLVPADVLGVMDQLQATDS